MVVVLPGHAELDDPLGLHHPLQQSGLLVLGVGVDDGFQRGQDLLHGLQELGLVGVLGLGRVQDSLDVLVHNSIPPNIICPVGFDGAPSFWDGIGENAHRKGPVLLRYV